MARRYGNWVDGDWREPVGGRVIERRSPAHGEPLAAFAESQVPDVDAAVRAAKAAFDGGAWSRLPGSARAEVLRRWADLIVRDAEKLAVIEAEEVGKPIKQARGEIGWAIELLRYAAALAWQIKGDLFTDLGPAQVGLVTREPRGVVGIVVPWNFPLVTLFQKLPYALAAGCTAVVKPSGLTSGTALEVAALATEAGIPAGAVSVVTGHGAVAGEALSTHPGVDMLTFTGSTAVGKRIARHAADGVKRLALQLGGKAANIVFADADLDAALDGVLLGAILNQGEECCAGARLLVEARIAEEFQGRLVERAGKVKVGLPLAEDTDIGALIHEQHMRSVLDHVAGGEREGARLLLGGRRVTDGDLAAGCFIGATVFADVSPEMAIFRDEIFGPVVTTTTFRTAEEAIRLANDTRYGLANGLWTKDVDKAITVSRALKSGTVYVNTFLETAPQLPFGGFKESGVGRENGLEGLLEFTEIKSTFIKLGARSPALPHAI